MDDGDGRRQSKPLKLTVSWVEPSPFGASSPPYFLRNNKKSVVYPEHVECKFLQRKTDSRMLHRFQASDADSDVLWFSIAGKHLSAELTGSSEGKQNSICSRQGISYFKL